MPYYDEKKNKYISKYNRLARLRTNDDDFKAETEREKEIQRIVDRMQDIPPEFMLDDAWTIQKAKKRSRKEKRIAEKK